MYLLIIGAIAILLGSFILLDQKKKLGVSKVLKILAVALFFTYLIRLYSTDSFDSVFNLLLVDIKTPINAHDTWLMSVGLSLIVSILRWFTLPVLAWAIIASFNENRYIKWISAFGIVVALGNIIFFKENVIAFNGSYEALSYRSIQFFIETVIFMSLSGLHLYSIIKEKLFIGKKEIFRVFVIMGLSLIAMLPLTLLYNLFGNFGEVPLDFNIYHLALIVLPFILIIVLYFSFRKLSSNARYLLVLYLSFASFYQFLYVSNIGFASLPFHLCNTVGILLLFANVFKSRRLFYFSYFAGVLGGIAAIILPNYELDLFSRQVIHFTFNHLYVVIVPVLGVILGVFPKPTIKLMFKAIGVLTIYYIIIVILNAWFNNYESVDYFFAYSDFLTDMFGVKDLQYDNQLIIEAFGLKFVFFWAYQILFFLSFIGLMFVMWFIYDLIDQVIINSRILRGKEKKIKDDHLALLKLLAGKPLSEPMNLGGVDMIRVINFSKRYGHSDKFAVNNLSFEVPKGQIYGFLGHNGAGKSTTIKSLVGIQSITEGDMEICGYSIKSQPLEAKLKIGYVSDNHAVYEKLTGREYIQYVADLYRVDHKVREERLTDLSKRLSLDHALDNLVKSYSHGMKQKLVVIASLIHEPPVWILDEPLTGLDPISAFQIKEIMKQHAQKGHIVFFSSHVIEVIEKICDKIVVITQGQLVGIFDVSILNSAGTSLEDLYMTNIKQKDGIKHV